MGREPVMLSLAIPLSQRGCLVRRCLGQRFFQKSSGLWVLSHCPRPKRTGRGTNEAERGGRGSLQIYLAETSRLVERWRDVYLPALWGRGPVKTAW